jgi:hypothetical protein
VPATCERDSHAVANPALSGRLALSTVCQGNLLLGGALFPLAKLPEESPHSDDPRALKRSKRQQIVLVAGDEGVSFSGLRHGEQEIIGWIWGTIDARKLYEHLRMGA